jgi:pimeloyl-ACP methyl ester carboxylesterase
VPRAKPTLLAVIPGNPGDAVFYGDFVRALEAHGHEVTVASHLLLPGAPDGLLSYAVHQTEAITRYLAGSGRSPADVELVLVGHSVGAYLAYLIVARRLLPVSRVFLLCPFLARPSLSGRLILKVATSPRALAAGLLCWRLLPAGLQRRLVRAVGAGAHGEWVRAALASGQPLAWGAMAQAEASEIASRADASYLFDEPLFQDPQRFVPVLCRRDRWAPARWPGVPCTHGLTHAFVVDPAQCQLVAGLIHERLSAFTGEPEERGAGRVGPRTC